jgi:hypothetical protein
LRKSEPGRNPGCERQGQQPEAEPGQQLGREHSHGQRGGIIAFVTQCRNLDRLRRSRAAYGTWLLQQWSGVRRARDEVGFKVLTFGF